jgi:hypothetical protein
VKSARWRDKQERSERDIDCHRKADASCMDQGIQIFKRLRMLTAFPGTASEGEAQPAEFFTFELFLGPGTLDVEFEDPLMCWPKLSKPPAKSKQQTGWIRPKERYGCASWTTTRLPN